MENLTITRVSSKPFSSTKGQTNQVGIQTVEHGDKWLNSFIDNVDFNEGDIISAEIVQNGQYTNFDYKNIVKKSSKKTYTQGEEIRANVALKMVSEIIAGGKAELKDWEKLANTFYYYEPKQN